MLNYHLSFQSPWYLLLLAVIPALWWLSFRTLAGLGPVRRWLALLLRSAVLGLLILALAEAQIVRVTDRLTVIYLLDQSLSIPAAQREAMVNYVNAAVAQASEEGRPGGGDRLRARRRHRDPPLRLRREADEDRGFRRSRVHQPGRGDEAGPGHLRRGRRQADRGRQRRQPEPGQRRWSRPRDWRPPASASTCCRSATATWPRWRSSGWSSRPTSAATSPSTSAWSSTTSPCRGRRNTPAWSTANWSSTNPRPREPGCWASKPVTLPPGKKVFTVRQQIDAPNFYTYEARFIPDRPEDDTMPQNNRATAFTQVQGKGQVLLIEDCEHKGEHDLLVERLRQQGLQVTVRSSDMAFQRLADLQPFDAVVLANVPRATNENIHFTDDQIDMLVRNTQQMGAGLVMLGGPNSFGAGGWTGTELEKAMPVDFQIKNAKVVPRGALVMLMHASEIAEGNHWQKVIAKEAIKTLGAQDYCGVIHWCGRRAMAVESQPVQGGRQPRPDAGPDRSHDARRHAGLRAGVRQGAAGFASLQDAAVKHMIVISDGDPSPPTAATHRRPEGAEGDRLDGGGGRPRAGREPEPLQHRHADRRQVLRGQQSQGPAADLSARGPPRRPLAGLRARHGAAPGDPRGSTKSSAASTPCRRSPASCSPTARRTPWWKRCWSRPSRPASRTTRSWPPGPTGWARRWPSPATTAAAGPSMARRARLRQALRPDGPLGDAARRRHGKIHHRHRSGRRADPRGRQRPGQERRVPQFPGHDGHGGRPRPETAADEDDADRAGPLRRHAAGPRLRQLFHRRRPRRRHGPHPHRRDRALFRRIPRPGHQRRPAGPTGRAGAQGGRGGQGDRGRRPKARPWSNWPRSTPSATTCPRPPAARTSGTTWCCWAAACSSATSSSAACRSTWRGCRRWPAGPATGSCAAGRRRRRRRPWIGCGAARPRWPGSSSSFARRRASRPRRRRPSGWTPWRKRPPRRRPAAAPSQPPLAQQKSEEESYTERLLRAKKKVWKEKRDQGPGIRD